jgi:hypothetical protein
MTAARTCTATFGLARFAPGWDTDGLADPAVWRAPSGMWYGLRSGLGYDPNQPVARQWGHQAFGDVSVPGDYDGDGLLDPAVWRPGTGTWHVLPSASGYQVASAWAVQWGHQAYGDVPVPGDYDGDGQTDLAVWRKGPGVWYVLRSSTNYTQYSAWTWGGDAYGDVPVPGDYDGDGKTDPAVWRKGPGVWYALKSSTGYSGQDFLAIQWGADQYGDEPVPADYDGDGQTDPAVWRQGWGIWYALKSSTGYSVRDHLAVQWGGAAYGDVPVVADYDGDGKADPAVWRAPTGWWYALRSSLAYSPQDYLAVHWGHGTLGDTPATR